MTCLIRASKHSLGTILRIVSVPEWDLNLGLSMSHRVKYEAAILATQPLWLDRSLTKCLLKLASLRPYYFGFVHSYLFFSDMQKEQAQLEAREHLH